MLLVLLLLVLHRAVLPAGIAAVLRCDAIAVFGDVTVGGQKVSPAALALAGRVAVVQSVHQVEYIEVNGAPANHALCGFPFFLIVLILKIFESCDNSRIREKFLYPAKRHLLQQDQKAVILVKALMRRLCEGVCITPLRSAQIFLFECADEQAKIIDRHQDSQDRLAKGKRQVRKMRLLFLIVPIEPLLAQGMFKSLIRALLFAIAKRRASIQPGNRVMQQRFQLCRNIMALALFGCAQIVHKRRQHSDTLQKRIVDLSGKVQNLRCKLSCRKLLSLVVHTVIPAVHCHGVKRVILIRPDLQKPASCPISVLWLSGDILILSKNTE